MSSGLGYPPEWLTKAAIAARLAVTEEDLEKVPWRRFKKRLQPLSAGGTPVWEYEYHLVADWVVTSAEGLLQHVKQ